ncbi:g12372 [Coccomyxa viridis]|uniref:G12372 protein n=1 Tax=Coccomyxa viridis TaxID=1274662 RepID=A0ABP1GA69_9CHLO
MVEELAHELVLAWELAQAQQSLGGWRASVQLALVQVPEQEQLLAPEWRLLSGQGLVQAPAQVLGLALQLLLD